MATIEPYESALDAIPGAHPYPRSSRYHDAEIGVHTLPDGTEVRYTKRRLLPPLPEGHGGGGDETSDTLPHTVSDGERPDLLAQRYLGAPDQWWQIADANPVLDPHELTEEPGRTIEVPLPGGFPRAATLGTGPGARRG
ncbi:hypothetical protein [Streptomyces sp. TS71-3]|uniref:hypothetical protein n=1 Tax=Streptomyces sp. TS71-3 TaxID=2733862 RepID=UPI001B1EB67C|nr:hypothetical protein [Streptomyces sp. TS71-3]GHJ35077.1 hypothetical protein Sm713_06860 [Streptomyces sp. TS71-3]